MERERNIEKVDFKKREINIGSMISKKEGVLEI